MINYGFYDEMKKRGMSYETTASLRKFECPNCGFKFSMVYARAIACSGCSEVIKGCPKVRCAKCDHEFYIEDTPDVDGKLQQRFMADHICNIVNARYKERGITEYNR